MKSRFILSQLFLGIILNGVGSNNQAQEPISPAGNEAPKSIADRVDSELVSAIKF